MIVTETGYEKDPGLTPFSLTLRGEILRLTA